MSRRDLNSPRTKESDNGYLYNRLGIVDAPHPLITSGEGMAEIQLLFADIVANFPANIDLKEYDMMTIPDKANFIQEFLFTQPIREHLQRVYDSNPTIVRSVMHITESFLKQDPRHDFAFLVYSIFLGDTIARKYKKVIEGSREATQLKDIDAEQLRQALNGWEYLTIIQGSSWGNAHSRFPVNLLLQKISAVFVEVTNGTSPLEEILKQFLYGDDWPDFSVQIFALAQNDPPEILLRTGVIKKNKKIELLEMCAFRSLLTCGKLACHDGIMHELTQKKMHYFWFQLIAERPELLREAQKFPKCLPNNLKKQNPLRHSLQQLLGELSSDFFALTPKSIITPFSAILIQETPARVVEILEPAIELEEVDVPSLTEEDVLMQERCALNLRITRILNGIEKASIEELQQLVHEEEDISRLLRGIVRTSPELLSHDEFEREKKIQEHAKKHVDIDVSVVGWNGPVKGQLSNIDLSLCEVPRGAYCEVTCQTPDGVKHVLLRRGFPLETSIIQIPRISGVYKGGRYTYTVTFFAPKGKEFSIDTANITASHTTDYINADKTPEEKEKERQFAQALERNKLIVRFNLLQILQARQKTKTQEDAENLLMLSIAIILTEHHNDLSRVRPDKRGNIRFNLYPFQKSLGSDIALSPEAYVITVDADSNISIQLRDEVRVIILGMVEVIRAKNDPSIPTTPTAETNSQLPQESSVEEPVDHEYLAFRRLLQPIFDCLNSYNFDTQEKGANLKNPFPSLQESLLPFGANLYMSGDKKSITLLMNSLERQRGKGSRKRSANADIFDFLMGDTPEGEERNAQCTITYDSTEKKITRRLHGRAVTGMRETGESVPPIKLQHGQRAALRDLELRLAYLLRHYSAPAEEENDSSRSEKELCDLALKYEAALKQCRARVMLLPSDITADAWRNGIGNTFPSLKAPRIKKVGNLGPIFAAKPNGVRHWILYAEGAIEFHGERKRASDEQQAQETTEKRRQRLESLRQSLWGRELLRERVVATLKSKSDRINVGSPGYLALKSYFTDAQWNTKSRLVKKVDDIFLDKFIDTLIAQDVSVTFRRPVLRTPEEHAETLAKIGSQEKASTTAG